MSRGDALGLVRSSKVRNSDIVNVVLFLMLTCASVPAHLPASKFCADVGRRERG
jgi:hypothetical protein